MGLFNLFQLAGEVILDSAETLTGLNNVQNAATRTGEVFKKIGGGISSAGKSLSTFVTLPILGAMGASIKLASDMNETVSKTGVVFKNGTQEVLNWSDKTLKSIGLAKGTALDMASVYGDMGTAMGLSGTEAQKMAMNLVNLTGDMASFKNMKPDEIHIALTGAYTGETEALKRLGIVMTVANLEQFALSTGIKKTYKEMTQAEKIQLRYNYIMKASKNSVGDFERTQASASNQMRIFSEGMKETGARMGTILLPFFTKAVNILNRLLDRFSTLNPHMQKVSIVIGLLAAAVGPLLIVFGSLIGAIGSIITFVGALSTPLLIIVGVVGVVIAEWVSLITVFIVVAKKAGLLKLAIEGIKNTIQVFISILKGDTNKALDILIKKFGYSREEAIKFIAKVVDLKDKILILANKIKVELIKAFNFLVDKVKEVTKWLYDHRREIMKIIETLVDFGIKVVETADKVVEFVKRVKAKIMELKATFDKEFNEIKTIVSNKFNEIKDRIVTKLSEWKATIQGWFNNMPSTLKELLQGWKAAIVKWTNEQNEENKRQFEIWKETLSKWFEAQKKNIKIWFNGWIKSLKQSFEDGKKAISEKLDGWWGAIKGWFTAMPKKHIIKSSGRSMIDKVSEGNKEKKKEFIDKLGKLIVDVMVGAGKVAFVAAIATGREIIKRIIDGVNNKIPALKSRINNVVGYITKPIKSLARTMFTSGKNLIGGLIDGIKSKFGDLKNTVAKGAGIIGNFLGFSSPTKEGPGSKSDKWMPNLMMMLAKTMLGKRALLRESVEKIAGDLNFNNFKNMSMAGVNTGFSTSTNSRLQEKIALVINNPKFFNQQDIDKMMDPVVRRLQSTIGNKRG